MITENGYVLGIEAAIAGGSLSIVTRDGTELGCFNGSGAVARSEDLLADIDGLLKSSGTDRSQLELITVSAGPGSFTGIRIGIATAMGLAKGLAVPVSSESALTAVAKASAVNLKDTTTFIVLLPVGRDTVCYQSFANFTIGITAAGPPSTFPQDSITGLIKDESYSRCVAHPALRQQIEAHDKVIWLDDSLARLIAQACLGQPSPVLIDPLFVSKAN